MGFFTKDRPKDIKNPGALPDPRPLEERMKDYTHDEIGKAFQPPRWVEKDPSIWRKFKVYNQDGSSSCVSQAIRLALGIENFIEEKEYVSLSARDIYTRRVNFPGEGMYFPDAMSIGAKYGATLEALMPDDNLPEKDMNSAADRTVSKEQVALVYKPKNYVEITSRNIDEIAAVIQSGKAVILGFRFTYDEWTDIPTIKSNLKSLGHGVAGVDFTLWKGKKAIVIQDSWGDFNAWKGQRLITQEFLDARCFYAGYFIDLANNWRDNAVKVPPSFNFTKELKFGDRGSDVYWLQEVLKYEQLFPQDVVSTPGDAYYGAITAKGVLAFQKNHGVAPPATLDALGGRVVGPSTLAELNRKYGIRN